MHARHDTGGIVRLGKPASISNCPLAVVINAYAATMSDARSR